MKKRTPARKSSARTRIASRNGSATTDSLEELVRDYMESLASELAKQWDAQRSGLLGTERAKFMAGWRLGFTIDPRTLHITSDRIVVVGQPVGLGMPFTILDGVPHKKVAEGSFSASQSPRDAALTIASALASALYDPY